VVGMFPVDIEFAAVGIDNYLHMLGLEFVV
jgi:hypothetical protein